MFFHNHKCRQTATRTGVWYSLVGHLRNAAPLQRM